MKLFIKHMLSIRCKMIVKDEMDKLNIPYAFVGLGEVDIKGDISEEQRFQLKSTLLEFGLELMDDKKAILIEKIKKAVNDMVRHACERPKVNFSDYLSEQLKYDYTYLANLFSVVTGLTIECYIIAYKVELVKEMLIYDELTLTQITYKLNYSSVSHLSRQFKKTTGLTPTTFRELRLKRENHWQLS